MTNERNNGKNPGSVNWGKEILHVFSVIGKIFLKLLEESLPFFELTLNYRGNRLSNAVLNGNDLPIEKEEP